MKSVSEFARAKGIGRSRAYSLARSGVLPVHRLSGGGIVLDDAAMDWQPRRGRPLSERMAWGLLMALDGVAPAGLRDAERARIKAYAAAIAAAEDPARELASKVSARAQLHEFVAHSDDVGDLRADARVHLSGVGAPGSGMVAGDVVEGYVSASALGDLVNDYLLKERPFGNVRLRVGEVRPVGKAAMAADLADWGRAREVRESNRIIRELLQEMPLSTLI